MFVLVIVVDLLVLVLGAPSINHHTPSLDGRIIGGRNADIIEYPYQVSLLYADNPHCGAAMISPMWVVTAGHCVAYYNEDFSIRAGSSQAETGGEVLDISKIIVHPQFDENLDYDIALLMLSTGISSENASPVLLPLLNSENTTIPEGLTLTITGWGDTDMDGDSPDVLQVVEVPVVNQDDCRAVDKYNITDRMFCAGIFEAGGKDACLGDSGSPAAIDGVLTGIVSWGIGCAVPHYPGVYTNVVALRSWINEVTGL